MDKFTPILKSLRIDGFRGASVEKIAAFEQQARLSLPDQVRELYLLANGFKVPETRLQVLDLEGCLKYVDAIRNFGIPEVWGYLPFTDSNDSNPFCVCCNGPVRGRVVHLHHDDSASLAFRTLEAFFGALLDLNREEEEDVDELISDYENGKADRTTDDTRCGQELLDLAKGLGADTIERGDSLRWAIQLLSEDCVASLLDDASQYVREDALGRLRSMASPKALDAVRNHEKEVRNFLERATEAVKKAGFGVPETQRGVLRVTSGKRGFWFAVVDWWFHRRHDPTVFDDVVKRAGELMKTE